MSDNPYANHHVSHQPMTPAEERSLAAGTHAVTGVATIMSAGTLGFVAALVVYLMYKDRGPFVRRAAANAMNIQLNALMWAVLVFVGGLFTIGVGWLLFFLIPVVMVVLHALAAWNTWKGEWYDPPLTIRFVS